VSAGKGDAPRPVDGERFRQNWDEIFSHKNQENLDMMSAFVHIRPHTPAATTPNDVEPAADAN
jgi:hypothetical protein